MEDLQIKMAQYTQYLESKDKFVERCFRSNKFFILLNIGLLAGLIVFNKVSIDEYLTAGLIISAVGVVSSLMYLGSIDAYYVLTRIKLYDVIEKIEEEFPLKLYSTEREAIEEWKTTSKSFMFTEMQKLMAYLMLLIFGIKFLREFVPFVMFTFQLF